MQIQLHHFRFTFYKRNGTKRKYTDMGREIVEKIISTGITIIHVNFVQFSLTLTYQLREREKNGTLTICFPRTCFAAFAWQLNGFITIEFWTFVFNVSALNASYDSSSFRYLQGKNNEKNTHSVSWNKKRKKEIKLNAFVSS